MKLSPLILAITLFSCTLITRDINNCIVNRFIMLHDDEFIEQALSKFELEVNKHNLIFMDSPYFAKIDTLIKYNGEEESI